MADPNQERATVQARASVWNDGKRRVTVALLTRLSIGRQLLTLLPSKVIDDPILIKKLEDEGVDLIDLDVNGRPKLSRKQAKETDDARRARIEALANELDIIPTALIEAIDKGGYDAAHAVREAVEQRYTRELVEKLAIAHARVAELEEQLATSLAARPPGDQAPPASSGDGANGAADGPSLDELAGKA